MAYYDKKIIYLSCMENGDKIKSAGFIKMEISDNTCQLDMHISGMSKWQDKNYDVLIIANSGERHTVGKVYLCKGNGEWKGKIESGKIGDANLSNAEIAKFCIEISDAVLIEGKPGKTEMCTENIKPLKEAELKAGSLEAVNIIKETKAVKEIKMEDIILNDKWGQLMQTYTAIHPYEDNRIYISIQPKDFVIMTGDYQHLANNSFLLHGFYNYRHIILGKERNGETESFYLGVPGVYYEREKMVALMFGFEAFECVGGMAESGKFGYYLRKVNI